MDLTADASIPQPLDQEERNYLHQFLCDNTERIGLEILQGKQAGESARQWHEGDEELSPAANNETWEKVTSLLSALGPSPDSACRTAAATWEASPEHCFKTFIARNELRTDQEGTAWSHVIYEVPGNKVPYLLPRRRPPLTSLSVERQHYFLRLSSPDRRRYRRPRMFAVLRTSSKFFGSVSPRIVFDL